jgi:hypothetical protein
MNKLVATTLSLALGTSTAFAAAKVFNLNGTSALQVVAQGEGHQITKTETRFFENMYGEVPTIFKVVTHSVTNTNVDGLDERTYLEAYPKMNGQYEAKAWSLKIKGGDFEIFNDHFVQTTEAGCCDSPNINHLIHSKTGKEVVTAMNDTALEIEVPNSQLPSRYIAQIQEAKTPAKRGSREYIATIAYFDTAHVKSVARIYAKVPPGVGSDLRELTPVLNKKDEKRRHTLTLWSSDGIKDAKAAFTGVGVAGDLYLGETDGKFQVIIENDQLSGSLSRGSAAIEIVVAHAR